MRREFVGSGPIGSVIVALGVAALGSLTYACGEISVGTCADNGTCVATDAGDSSVAPPDAIVVTGDALADATLPADGGDGAESAESAESGEDGGGDVDAATDTTDASDATDGTDASECAITADPSISPCLVDDAYGVFVSAASGQDDAGTPGTKSAPWKTITEGIQAAAASSKSRVYVCAGTYSESLLLDANHDGVSLYGGFDCAEAVWTWTGDKALVNAPSALYGLRINATSKPIAVEDIAFTAPNAVGQDPSGNGNSSIAAFVSNASAAVSLLRVTLQAGTGTNGSAGAPPVTNWFSANAGDLQGNGADGGSGGAQKDCPCKQWGDSMGGPGGAGSQDPSGNTPGGDGGAGIADPAAPPQGARTGAGGRGFDPMTQMCAPGLTGADGIARIDGGAGAEVLGAVALSGWVPGSGASGVAGNPGQGAGGGGGGATAGGGGGGCGGCGGAGGGDGHGGGASIALLAWNAAVNVQACTLTTNAAGGGGSGSAGESGGGGGGGNIGACGGGNGGNGGGGQGGGGGAGGVSVAVLFDSSSGVLIDMTTRFTQPVQPAPGGLGGGGGTGGSTGNGGLAGSNGLEGTVRETLSL